MSIHLQKLKEISQAGVQTSYRIENFQTFEIILFVLCKVTMDKIKDFSFNRG